ncbi:hypothetical protein OEA41_000228 [Lepraria neglecta]|uniref:Uncharacterized protein n=1 Tax=Lepraria neglecta TaxID=209136 RepID=A0AAD9ZG29_9LECA|nr:hypothetical protein OEA41_000228 [Lepraria neglecta]
MGRQNCWEAVGPARDKFTHLAEEIKEYLMKFSDSVSSTVTWSLYMTGRTKESSHPTVVFCSSDNEARRIVRKSIKSSGILKRYPGFVTMDCNRPPESQSIASMTVEKTDLDTPLTGPLKTIVLYSSSSGALGARLLISEYGNFSQMPKMATGGGALEWRGRYFLMTVAHAFGGSNEPAFPELNNVTNFEFDLDGMSGSDEDDDTSVAMTSRGSISPEGSISDTITNSNTVVPMQSFDLKVSQLSASLASSGLEHLEISDTLPIASKAKGYYGPASATAAKANYCSSVQPRTSFSWDHSPTMQPLNDVDLSESTFTSSEDGPHPSLDYILVEVIGWKLGMTDRIPPTDGVMAHEIFLKRLFRGAPVSREVIVITASKGVMKGHLSGTPSFMQLPHSTNQQELWTVMLEGNLEKGDCGSWVIDATNGSIYAHIIAGSRGSGFTYAVPLWQISNDIHRQFEGNWKLAKAKNIFREKSQLKPLLGPNH